MMSSRPRFVGQRLHMGEGEWERGGENTLHAALRSLNRSHVYRERAYIFLIPLSAIIA